MSYQANFRPELTTDPYNFTREIFTDEHTSDRVRRHLYDENDVITEADIENIKTEMTPADESFGNTAIGNF